MIQLKSRSTVMHNTSDWWIQDGATLVLLDGQIAVESDTGRWKIGNGVTQYSALSYQDGGLPRGQMAENIEQTHLSQIRDNIEEILESLDSRSLVFQQQQITRIVPDSVSTYAKIDSVGARSVNINQQLKNGNFANNSIEGWTKSRSDLATTFNNGILHIAVPNSESQGYLQQTVYSQPGEKFTAFIKVKVNAANKKIYLGFNAENQTISNTSWNTITINTSNNEGGNLTFKVGMDKNSSCDIEYVCLISAKKFFGFNINLNYANQIKSVCEKKYIEYNPNGIVTNVVINNIKDLHFKDIINKYFPNGMRGVEDNYDELDFRNHQAVKRTGIRGYQIGDEDIDYLVTDKTSTIYPLDQPVITQIDGGIDNHINTDNSLSITAIQSNKYQIYIPWVIRFYKLNNLVDLNIVNNGTYSPSEGAEGFKTISVNVPSSDAFYHQTGYVEVKNHSANTNRISIPYSQSYTKLILNIQLQSIYKYDSENDAWIELSQLDYSQFPITGNFYPWLSLTATTANLASTRSRTITRKNGSTVNVGALYDCVVSTANMNSTQVSYLRYAQGITISTTDNTISITPNTGAGYYFGTTYYGAKYSYQLYAFN